MDKIKNIDEIDLLKCVCIMLMVMFHLVYVEEQHPLAKQIVFTFHMPIFLMISGYLCNVEKHLKGFLRSAMAIALPYFVMEVAYIVGAAMLPINEHIDNLTVAVFFEKLFIHPIGPYWYLHTLLICNAINYVSYRLFNYNASFFPFMIILLSGMMLLNLINISSLVYYSVGVLIRCKIGDFRSLFVASPLSIVMLAGVVFFSMDTSESGGGVSSLGRITPEGFAFNFFIIGSLLFLFTCVKGKIRSLMTLVGKETLAILLFSPIFTFVSKFYQNLLCGIDPSGVLFAVVSVVVAVTGSILIKRAMQKFHVSRLLFLK